MIQKRNVLPPIEVIDARVVSALYDSQLIDNGIASNEHEASLQLLYRLEKDFSEAASCFMTGHRGKNELEDFQTLGSAYFELLSNITAKDMLDVFDETGSVDKAKQSMLNGGMESLWRVNQSDYEIRMKSSRFERLKADVAQRPLVSRAVAVGMSATTGTVAAGALLEITEATSVAELTFSQQGAALAVAGIAYRLAMRNAPKKIGDVVGGRVNLTLEPFRPHKSKKRKGTKTKPTQDELLLQFAEKHLTTPFDKLGRMTQEYTVDSRDDLVSMAHDVFEQLKPIFYETYGISEKEDRGAWYRTLLGRVALSKQGPNIVDKPLTLV